MNRLQVLASFATVVACLESGGADTDTETESSSGDADSAPTVTSTMSTTTGMTWDQTAACAAYLDCLEASSPREHEEALPLYGPAGSCWQSSVAMVEECDAACVQGYQTVCTGDGDSTGEPTGPLCSSAAVAPGIEPNLVTGPGEGELPEEIGELIDNYCGCHLVDPMELDELTPGYFGPLRINTWDDFHDTFQGQPVWQEVEARVVDGLSMPPLYFCGESDVGSFDAADFAELEAWLAAGAPDATDWP